MSRTISLALCCVLLAAAPAVALNEHPLVAYGGAAAEQDFQRYKQNIETSMAETTTALKAGQIGQAHIKAMEGARRFEQYNSNPAVTGNDFWRDYVADGTVQKRVTELLTRTTTIDGAVAFKKSYLAMREFYKKHEAALKGSTPAEATGQLAFLEKEGKAMLKRYEGLKEKGIDILTVTYVVDGKDTQGAAVLAEVRRMMGVAANRGQIYQQAQGLWRSVLKGDRLKIYLEFGQPEWADDVNGLDPASAARAPKWSYSRGPFHSLQLGRYRIYKEFHFSGDRLVNQTSENKPY